MSNLLTTAADGEPARVTAGDSLLWQRSDIAADYPPGEGYSLTYRFAPVAGGDPASADATDEDGVWQVAVPAQTTEAWAAGEWRWAAAVSKAGGRVVVDQGSFVVDPDPLAAEAPDRRSHARKVLDAIEATIEGRATSSQLKHTFEDGRSIEHMPHSELIAMRTKYVALVRREERRASGKGPGRLLARL
jgi:hypothetical protein